jgi:hypothetical protein
MKALTTLAAAAVLSLGVASASQAAVFAQFLPDLPSADFTWVKSPNTAAGGFGTEGTFTSSDSATHFEFLTSNLSSLGFLAATFNLTSAVVTPTVAIHSGTYTQQHVNGDQPGQGFSFIYAGPTGTFGGHFLEQGVTNLLSGVFTNAWIQGAGGSGSANLSTDLSPTASVTFTSDLMGFGAVTPGSAGFAFNILSVSPAFGCTNVSGVCTKALNSFTGNGGGNFSASGGIPEPATWGLMIMGFGGMGMVLRSRRRPVLAKA